jgi:hypothetical protein
LVIATILGCVFLFVIIKKLLKFLVVTFALIITASIIGYFFFTGNGELTKDFLPESEQKQLEQFREKSKENLKEQTGKIKNTAIKKVEQELDKAIQKSKERLGDEITGRIKQTASEERNEKPDPETIKTTPKTPDEDNSQEK